MNFLYQNVFLALILITPPYFFVFGDLKIAVIKPESLSTKKRVNSPESSQRPVDTGMGAPWMFSVEANYLISI